MYNYHTNLSQYNNFVPYKSDEHQINDKINTDEETRKFIEAKERDEFEVRKH